jgi:cytochrome P450 monooxygenase
MIQITSYTLLAGCLTILYYSGRVVWKHILYNRERMARGCGEIKTYNHYDPFFGIDFAYSLSKAFKEHRWLAWQKQVHASQGVKTFKANFLGSKMVYSSESENMKAMSTSNWKEFGIEPLRRANGVIDPIGGPGVSTSDGELWQFSRDLIKPYFTRSGYSDLGRLETHVDKLLELIPTDHSTFDLQPLMQRWVRYQFLPPQMSRPTAMLTNTKTQFLDTSSEFLFGETVDSLRYPERVKPSAAMIEMMRGLRVRLLLGKALFLHRDPKWFEAVRVIREFIGGNIDKTLAELENCKTTGKESFRTDLLWDMAKQLPDKEALLGQIIAVFIPSNDTTSILISNAFYAIARHPRVWAKLHEEVAALADTPLNFELLRGMKYVTWVLNESE